MTDISTEPATGRDTSTTTKTRSTAKTGGNGAGGPTAAVRDAAGNLIGVASQAAARLPDAAQTTRGAVAEAGRMVRTGSDEMLTAGTTLSIGLALGLLVGGASRLLVILALIPAAAMGFTLLERAQDRPTNRVPTA